MNLLKEAQPYTVARQAIPSSLSRLPRSSILFSLSLNYENKDKDLGLNNWYL